MKLSYNKNNSQQCINILVTYVGTYLSEVISLDSYLIFLLPTHQFYYILHYIIYYITFFRNYYLIHQSITYLSTMGRPTKKVPNKCIGFCKIDRNYNCLRSILQKRFHCHEI